MPRPRKCRKICCLPKTKGFNPIACERLKSPVSLTVDEYEAIRLIDKEGLSQEECSLKMEVARTTVQQIYTQARQKIAEALVDERPLRISGGDYRLCDGNPHTNGCACCKHKKVKCEQETE